MPAAQKELSVYSVHTAYISVQQEILVTHKINQTERNYIITTQCKSPGKPLVSETASDILLQIGGRSPCLEDNQLLMQKH